MAEIGRWVGPILEVFIHLKRGKKHKSNLILQALEFPPVLSMAPKIS